MKLKTIPLKKFIPGTNCSRTSLRGDLLVYFYEIIKDTLRFCLCNDRFGIVEMCGAFSWGLLFLNEEKRRFSIPSVRL